MKRKTLILTSVLLVLVLGLTLLSSCGKKEEEVEPEIPTNPLTGTTDIDEAAIGVRPAAIVVENAPDARPQWGMDDEEYAPDIILQGEVEGGITRTLWFYADYTKLPEIVGPIRSARPPYIKFSELFDGIFIHWGQSTTENGYTGANTVFKEDKVDHINQMSYSDPVGLYDRDSTRDVSSEHTGIIYGDKLKDAIEDKGFRTEMNENVTQLQFNKEAQELGEKTCGKMTLTISSRSYEDQVWTYDEESHLYKSDDFENNVARENLLILFDKTEYITKSNYHNSGSSLDYCDYKLAGGKGKLISEGTVIDIEWDVNENGQLELFEPIEESEEDEDSEEEPEKVMVKLNPGKTWIGWASSNNGGKVSIEEREIPEETEEAEEE